jgi:hypothetical protein
MTSHSPLAYALSHTRERSYHAAKHTVSVATGTYPCELLCDDKLMEVVELFEVSVMVQNSERSNDRPLLASRYHP